MRNIIFIAVAALVMWVIIRHGIFPYLYSLGGIEDCGGFFEFPRRCAEGE